MARRKKDDVLRVGKVSVEVGDKVYTVRYEVHKGGVVRLETGQATQIGGSTAEGIARQLLREIISSGLADQAGLGRPKTSEDTR